MAVVWGEGEGVDAVVGELPDGDGVGPLVLGVDRLVDVHLGRVVDLARAVGVAAGAGPGTLVLWREEAVLLFLVVDDQRAVHVCREEEVFGTRDPADLGDGRRVDDALRWSVLVLSVSGCGGGAYIFVEPGVPLGDGLPPDDFAGREAQDHVDVRRALGHLVHVMAQAVRLGEEDLCQVLGLMTVSS